MNLADKRICVTGGAGFLGRAVCAELARRGATRVLIPRSAQFDLTRAEAAGAMFDEFDPNVVIHLAAEVGGIGANQRNPGRYFYANMAMGMHLMEEARHRDIAKFVQVGTVCAYPKHCPVPFAEASLWEGYPEETNAPYGVAKRALGVMLEAYRQQYGLNGIHLVPVNLYGPGDNFDPETSHVIPALVRQFCDAADGGLDSVTCWGTGRASREFLFVDDAADAIVRATEIYDDSKPVNLGTGEEITIGELATKIAGLCGFAGRIGWDNRRPDGQPRRCLDTSRATESLGWRAKTRLGAGLERTIAWWRSQPGGVP